MKIFLLVIAGLVGVVILVVVGYILWIFKGLAFGQGMDSKSVFRTIKEIVVYTCFALVSMFFQVIGKFFRWLFGK